MNKKLSIALLLLLVLATGAGGFWVSHWYFSGDQAAHRAAGSSYAERFAGLKSAKVYGEPRYLSDFALHDSSGTAFGRAQIQGQWHLVFFGFASCPDICPTTLALLAAVREQLSQSAASTPQVLFISVDPERDDGPRMQEYARGFDPDFLAATGPHPQLQALTLQMGAPYLNNRPPADAHAAHRAAAGTGNGTADAQAAQIDHSAAVFLTDPQGRLVAAFAPPLRIEAMASDLRQIIDGE